MVGRYRKKPVTVEALQWTGDNIKEVDQFVGCSVSLRAWDRVLYLYMDEKTYPLNRMDYIIKEPNGRVYPCSWETFQETYEEAEPDVYLVGQRCGKTLRWKQSGGLRMGVDCKIRKNNKGGYHLYLNGVDISEYVSNLSLSINPNCKQPPEITIDIPISSLDCDRIFDLVVNKAEGEQLVVIPVGRLQKGAK